MDNSVSVNQHMKNTDFRVGVLSPPAKYYKPELFSDTQATRDLNNFNHEIL